HTVQDRVDIRAGYGMNTDCVVERCVERMTVVACHRLLETAPPGREGGLFLGWDTRPIGQVVGDPEESIEGAHSAPLGPGQNTKSVVEIRCLAPGQAFAIGIRGGQGWSHRRGSAAGDFKAVRQGARRFCIPLSAPGQLGRWTTHYLEAAFHRRINVAPTNAAFSQVANAGRTAQTL